MLVFVPVPMRADVSAVTQGSGRFGGCGFYLLKGKPVYVWNLLDLKRVRWEGADALTPGKHTLEFDFKYEGLGFATLAFNNNSGLGRPGRRTRNSRNSSRRQVTSRWPSAVLTPRRIPAWPSRCSFRAR